MPVRISWVLMPLAAFVASPASAAWDVDVVSRPDSMIVPERDLAVFSLMPVFDSCALPWGKDEAEPAIRYEVTSAPAFATARPEPATAKVWMQGGPFPCRPVRAGGTSLFVSVMREAPAEQEFGIEVTARPACGSCDPDAAIVTLHARPALLGDVILEAEPVWNATARGAHGTVRVVNQGNAAMAVRLSASDDSGAQGKVEPALVLLGTDESSKAADVAVSVPAPTGPGAAEWRILATAQCVECREATNPVHSHSIVRVAADASGRGLGAPAPAYSATLTLWVWSSLLAISAAVMYTYVR